MSDSLLLITELKSAVGYNLACYECLTGNPKQCS